MVTCDILFAFRICLASPSSLSWSGVWPTGHRVSVFSMPTFARIVRGITLGIKENLHQAPRGATAHPGNSMFVHILRGTLSNIIVYLPSHRELHITAATSASWASLPAADARMGSVAVREPRLPRRRGPMILFPGIAIFLTVLFFNLFGDGLRAALDPKTK
jgi:glutathione transport system permease protein